LDVEGYVISDAFQTGGIVLGFGLVDGLDYTAVFVIGYVATGVFYWRELLWVVC
jgi:hypothetical protein